MLIQSPRVESIDGAHVIPHSLAGADNVANLQLLCAPCNQRKGASFRQLHHLRDAGLRDQPAAQRRLRPLPAAVPDLVYRPFVADVPDRPWASDTTEHRDEGPTRRGVHALREPPGC